MSKLRFLVSAAKLRRYTELKALGANRTRWSSTYVILERYLRVREHILKLDIPGIVTLILTPTEDKTIESLCSKLSDLDSVAKALQSDNMTVHEASVLFDSIIDSYPCTKDRFAAKLSLVLNSEFEAHWSRFSQAKQVK